jgi:hypothetical protein
MALISLPIKVSISGDLNMTTATIIAPSPFGQLMANPLLEGKVIKNGIHTFYPFMLEDIQVGSKTLIQSPKGERLLTSSVQYFEFITQGNVTVGVVVTENSIYKVCVQ